MTIYTTIGIEEEVKIYTKEGLISFFARIDTGAAKSSIDINIAKKLELGPVVKEIKIRSAEGRSTRPVIKSKINILDKELDCEFTLADRSHMHFPVLIGRDILTQNFIIDCTKKHISKKEV